MPNVDKLVVSWSGTPGSPGYTTFWFSASQGPSMQPKVVAFWQAVVSYFPTTISWIIPNNGETIDVDTGKMVNVWAGGAQTTVNGTASTPYASTSGALVRLETGQFNNGRHVRGRIFLVPINSANYAAGGVITQATCNAIKAAADTLNSTIGQWNVYSRPVYDHTTEPPTLKKAGRAYSITSTVCPTKVTYLSSRRD